MKSNNVSFISVSTLKQTVKRRRITGFVSRANLLAKWIKWYEEGKCTFNRLIEIYYQIEKK